MDRPKEVTYRKSSFSGTDGCVEVAQVESGGRRVRDSKLDEGPTHFFTEHEWAAFIAAVRNGEFD